jgi:hypothetical protein
MTPRIGNGTDFDGRCWKAKVILALAFTTSKRRWRGCLGLSILLLPPLPWMHCTDTVNNGRRFASFIHPQGNCRYNDVDILSRRVSSFSSAGAVESWLAHQTDEPKSIDEHERWTTAPKTSSLLSTQLLSMASSLSSTTTTNPPSYNDDETSSHSTVSTTFTWRNQILTTPNYKLDTVERVIDATTLRLRNSGNISLQTVRGAGSVAANLDND